jgi:surfeit locus 1 family protein
MRELCTTLAAVALVALFVFLGFWQLSRAEEKRAFLAAFDAGLVSVPGPPPAPGADIEALRYRAIRATGSFDPAHQVLLDARTREGRAGYEVLTPLVRANGPAILVNRGWVPANPDRSRLPDVAVGASERTLTGYLDRLPRAAIGGRSPQSGTGWPRRMLYPTTADVAAATDYPVTDWQLLLGAGEPDGFQREWRPAVMTPTQHLGYAVQWFALAGALVVIYVVLNWRRARATPPNPR